MAKSENNKKLKGWKKALIISAIVLGIGAIVGVPAAIGLFTIARDLMFTLFGVGTLAVGGITGAKVIDKIKTNRNKKNNQLSQELDRIPTQEQDLSQNINMANVNADRTRDQKRSNSRK